MPRRYGQLTAIDYLDFEIEVGAALGGQQYPVAVLRSPAGEARDVMRFPYDGLALDNRLLELENALLRSGVVRRRIEAVDDEKVQELGQSLFDALITGEIRSRFDTSIRLSEEQGRGLRIKLRIQAPEMATLPWELLYDPRQGEYVTLSRATPIVRYLELPQSLDPLRVAPPLRILAMAASPRDLPPLDLNLERQRVEAAVADLHGRKLVELTWLEGQTWRDLQRAMREGPWHVFHFIGHGDFDPNTDEGLIALADDDGRTYRLSATQLGRLLDDHFSLRLAILNSCEGAHGSSHDLISSTAATLVRRGIPAVVAMQHEISDDAAIELARTFYDALSDGLPVDAAVSEARKAICLALPNSLEWSTPVLFLRSPDGRIFDVDQQAVPATAQPDTDPPLPLKDDASPAAINSPVSAVAVPDAPTHAISSESVSKAVEASASVAASGLVAPATAASIDSGAPAVLAPPSTSGQRPSQTRQILMMAGAALVLIVGGALGIRSIAGEGDRGSNIIAAVTTTPPVTETLALPSPTSAPATPETGPVVVPSDQETPVTYTGRLAFVREMQQGQAASQEIVVRDLATGNEQQITDNQVPDLLTHWSPDGQRIAYTSTSPEDVSSGNFDIWVANADGSDQHPWFKYPPWDAYPAWSPDGTRIAFSTTADTDGAFNSEIHTVDEAGDLQRITFNTERDEAPNWSPDGTSIAFGADPGDDMGIYAINLADGTQRTLINTSAYENQPVWSPDGQEIAFVRKYSKDDEYGNIWLVSLDGELVQLTFDDDTADPAWSPDGQVIAFTRFVDVDEDGSVSSMDESDIWTVNIETEELTPLIDDPEPERMPSWANE